MFGGAKTYKRGATSCQIDSKVEINKLPLPTVRPKNNAGRDVMIDSPSFIDNEQLNELNIKLK